MKNLLFSLHTLWGLFLTRILKRKFTRDAGVLTISNVAGAVLSFAQVLVVARWLGPQQYGIAALIMSYPALLFSFLDARSSTATVKFLSQFSTKGQAHRALAMCKLGYGVDFAIACVTFLLVVLTARWAESRLVHASGTATLMLLYAFAFLPQALTGTSRAVLSVCGRFQTLSWMNLLVTTVRVAAVLGLVLGGWGVAGVIWGNAVGMIASGFLFGASAYPLIRSRWGASWLSADWRTLRGQRKEVFSFLFFMNLSELSGSLIKRLDILILGYFQGAQETGYYRLAKSLAAVIGYVVNPLQTVSYPKLALLASPQRQVDMKRLVHRLALQVGAPMAGLSLISIAVVPLLISTVVGRAFLPAIPAAQALLAGSAVWLAFFWLRPTFMALGELRVWWQLGLINVTVGLAGMIISSFLWGYLGLAFWLLGSQIWGHVLVAGWLFLRKWRIVNADLKEEVAG